MRRTLRIASFQPEFCSLLCLYSDHFVVAKWSVGRPFCLYKLLLMRCPEVSFLQDLRLLLATLEKLKHGH